MDSFHPAVALLFPLGVFVFTVILDPQLVTSMFRGQWAERLFKSRRLGRIIKSKLESLYKKGDPRVTEIRSSWITMGGKAPVTGLYMESDNLSIVLWIHLWSTEVAFYIGGEKVEGSAVREVDGLYYALSDSMLFPKKRKGMPYGKIESLFDSAFAAA